MTVALREPSTLAEFLAWEERQELRYEFDGMRPVAMTGGTLRHNLIAQNIVVALRTRLRGGPCRVWNADVKIVASSRVRYPDVLVTCSEQNDLMTQATDPVVVLEVISSGTARTDRVAKFNDYLTLASVAHYVIVEQSA
ncbi:MAG: Uma2 family endonuclease, partial [Acidisphaera sp.]|nr:Uma2 family endonuclease [Acidisphaera sp.]MBV9813020.1 Uma2 family endonuclease [Acetobacteraceae bacterium]